MGFYVKEMQPTYSKFDKNLKRANLQEEVSDKFFATITDYNQ